MKKTLKIIAIVLISLLAFLLLALGATVWILTPSRLTPLVNEMASEQMNATVSSSRVELTFWKTFPRLIVEVDSLQIISHSLDSVDAKTRALIPAGADSLASVKHFRAGIDVLSLLATNINLYDVEFHSPKVNIVQIDSLQSNYNIFPPSAESKEPLLLPNISINRFAIVDGFPISFTSVADSMQVKAHLAAVDLSGNKAPVYTLKVDGSGGTNLPTLHLPSTPFGLNGSIHWQSSNPGAIKLENLAINADKVTVSIDAAAQLLDTIAVNQLKIVGKDLDLSNLISLVPPELSSELSKIKTNLKASFSAELLAPYIPSTGKIPPLNIYLNVPRGQLTYAPLELKGFETEIEANVNPSNLDLSTINIKKISAQGQSIDFTLSAEVTQPLTDALVKGSFKGLVSFNRLPSQLTTKLPCKISGTLDGNAKFRLRSSDLTPKTFHRARLDGTLNLRNFRASMNDGSGNIFTRHASLRLGTNSTVKIKEHVIDSLLTANLDIDTLAAAIPGLNLQGSALKMGVGAKNEASLLDTTQITPLGISMSAKHLVLHSDSDSINLKLQDAQIRASLTRYKKEGRSPLLHLGIDLGRLRLSDRLNRLTLRDVTTQLSLHPKVRPKMSRRVQAAYDSIAALNPQLSSDSIRRLAYIKTRRNSHSATSGSHDEKIDWGIDNSLRSYLRLWQAEGSVKARRARLFTPYFPVRNVISNLDLYLSTDSIVLHNTQYKMGKSDFLINGSVRNISRALTSRRGTPLSIDFDVRCDSLDINDLTRAMMMGSAFTQKIQNGEAKISNSDNDDVLEASIATQVDETDRAAVLIPTNIDARINVRAKNMKYGDILFQRFVGMIEASKGAVHLDRLGAYTPMGSFGMTALYSAPNKDDIQFAGGIVIRRLHLHQFLRMLPEIDSILPMLNSMEGIITAECAMASSLDSMMNLKFNTLDMALKLSGDSLVLLDSDTFKKIAKWLMFKHKNRNMIDSMSVELRIRDSHLQLYPFMVQFDRYKFGISGGNDMGLNLDYHIAVLKSPIPFKFGVNIKGTPEHLKIRLGRAKFNENQITSSRQLTDTARINLINEIRKVFKFGVANSKHIELTRSEPKPSEQEFDIPDTISASDSLFFIRQGVLTPPPGWVDPDSVAVVKDKKTKKRKKKK